MRSPFPAHRVATPGRLALKSYTIPEGRLPTVDPAGDVARAVQLG